MKFSLASLTKTVSDLGSSWKKDAGWMDISLKPEDF